MRCDFCSDISPKWKYDAKTFIHSGIQRSVGAWAACEICARMIEAGDYAGLALRSLNLLLIAEPDMSVFANELYDDLVALHWQFKINRIGPAVAIQMEEV